MRWSDRTALAKTAAVLGAVGIVSLGLCGVAAIGRGPIAIGILGAVGLIVATVGLLVLGIMVLVKWLVASISGR